MALVILIVLAVCLFSFPTLRCAVFHPVHLVRYGISDLLRYIKYERWNECQTGELVAYVGLFGKGKTLSAVHKVVSMYHRYNGRAVYDRDRQMWVEQRVKVLSNVALSIPYEDFVSLQQVVLCAEKNGAYDKENDTLTVTLVLGDEFSVQMNSRNFKSNIDPLFLNTLLTCRHYHISLYYTAQRFGHVDALLRQVTSYVVDCDKLWRFQRQNLYDAWEMENATNTQLLTPISRRCWFVLNKDYDAYNTLACVGNLQKSFREGDMMTEEEILSLRRNEQQANMDGVVKPESGEERRRSSESNTSWVGRGSNPESSCVHIVLQGAPHQGFSRAGPLLLCCYLRGGFPSKTFPGVLIHPVLYPANLSVCDLVEVGPFGEEPADHPVVILIAALLPCRIAVAVIHIKALALPPAAFPQKVVLQELAAVICGDAFEFPLEIRCSAFQPVYGPADGLRPPIRQLHDDLLTAHALCQGQQHTFPAFTADHQVHFPVSVFQPLGDVIRSGLYARQLGMGDPAPLSLGFGALLPFLPEMLIAQCQEYSLFDVAVQGVHADVGSEAFLPGRCQSCSRRIAVL